MKHRILLYAALLIVAFSSCSKDKSDASQASAQNVGSQVSSGTWKVSNFNYRGQDRTAQINQFRLNFATNGYLQASNDLFTESGQWAITTHNNLPSIMINLPSAHNIEVFQELSGDYWDVTAHTDNSIEMRRMIQDNPSTDYLTIKKL